MNKKTKVVTKVGSKKTTKIGSKKTTTPKQVAVPKKDSGATLNEKGNQILKAGQHTLKKSVYSVHGVELELEGRVFIAGDKVNWIPVKQCGSCRADRPEKVKVFNKDGCVVIIAMCNNAKACQYHGLYVWINKSIDLC